MDKLNKDVVSAVKSSGGVFCISGMHYLHGWIDKQAT